MGITTADKERQTKMRTISKWMVMASALALVLEAAPAYGQAPVIASFGRNGELVCTNLLPGTVASVEWAASVTGPWTNSWAGLDAVTADTNGAIRVSVPMFYRVRGTPPPTNPPAPAGMVLIPAGSFVMGDALNDWPPKSGPNPEIPVHTNQISAFYTDKYDVTKALWDDVYNWAITHGYSFEYGAQGKAANHPAHSMTWYDAVKWCNARSEKEGRTPAYYTDAGLTTRYRAEQVAPSVNWNSGYRLPTEAEWEKAARGGASGQRFPWGNNISWSQANYYGYPLALYSGGFAYDFASAIGWDPAFNDGVYPYTSPVDYFVPNGYGLYDMSGNVLQWCWDWYGSYSSASQTDPRGSSSGSYRLLRGGSWPRTADDCRAAARAATYPTERGGNMGFRSVLPPGQ